MIYFVSVVWGVALGVLINAFIFQGQQPQVPVQLSETTIVSLGTAAAVLGAVAAGAIWALRWLMTQFKEADKKREEGFAKMAASITSMQVSMAAMRRAVRAIQYERAETWCARMMENFTRELKELNPTLNVPRVDAVKLIAQARRAFPPLEIDEDFDEETPS